MTNPDPFEEWWWRFLRRASVVAVILVVLLTSAYAVLDLGTLLLREARSKNDRAVPELHTAPGDAVRYQSRPLPGDYIETKFLQ